MDQLTAIVIGAGDRGAHAYASYALEYPKELKIVGVAEPNAIRRNNLANAHHIKQENQLNEWRDVFDRPKFADFIILTTNDQMHFEPATKAMEQGYHVLLEKPMATKVEECRQLVETAEKRGIILQIGHVLRYTKLFSKIKEIIDSGKLGKITAINYSIDLSYWVYAHSFVRGTWRDSKETSPMILAKACHDMDMLYWFAGADPVKISSFSSPSYLTKKNRPEGAPNRCTDGCPHLNTCQYNAIDFYLKSVQFYKDLIFTEKKGMRVFIQFWKNHPKLARTLIPILKNRTPYRGWPISTISEDLSDEGILKALKEGNYGRCVYACDNDQVASQVTIIEFANQILATLTMHGQSYREGRTIRIDGSKGSLIGRFTMMGMPLSFYDHLTGKTTSFKIKMGQSEHGVEDWPLLKGFMATIRGEAKPLTSARESLQSHLMCFAADQSTRENKNIYLNN